MSTYELQAGMQLTITGPAVVAVAPPPPRGRAPGYDPESDPQLELMTNALKALGYDIVVVPREDVAVQGRFPAPKPRQEGPIQGEPDR